MMKFEEENTKYVKTGIPGFDDLFEHGIPKGSTVLIAGGTGPGKTNDVCSCLRIMRPRGRNVISWGLKNRRNVLVEHMRDFGWNPEALVKSGNLKIKRFLTAEIYYYDKKGGSDIQAMINKEVDPLLMELEPLSITDTVGFKPDFIVLDSLTAISSTFQGKEQSYRFYVERLFRFFEKIGATTFLIKYRDTADPEVFSPTGVEEFWLTALSYLKTSGGRTRGRTPSWS